MLIRSAEQDIERVIYTEKAIAARVEEIGAELTPEGERLLEAYDDYCRQLRAFADGLFQEKFGYLQEE